MMTDDVGVRRIRLAANCLALVTCAAVLTSCCAFLACDKISDITYVNRTSTYVTVYRDAQKLFTIPVDSSDQESATTLSNIWPGDSRVTAVNADGVTVFDRTLNLGQLKALNWRIIIQ